MLDEEAEAWQPGPPPPCRLESLTVLLLMDDRYISFVDWLHATPSVDLTL
jgi:hypothetical protein